MNGNHTPLLVSVPVKALSQISQAKVSHHVSSFNLFTHMLYVMLAKKKKKKIRFEPAFPANN